MGKLVKGLLAVSVPVLLLVGIVSCGGRSPVMASAEAVSTTYRFNATFESRVRTPLINKIYTDYPNNTASFGEQVIDLHNNYSSGFPVGENDLIWIRQCDYTYDTNGGITIVPDSIQLQTMSFLNDPTIPANYAYQLMLTAYQYTDWMMCVTKYVENSSTSKTMNMMEWGPSLTTTTSQVGLTENSLYPNGGIRNTSFTSLYNSTSDSWPYYKIETSRVEKYLMQKLYTLQGMDLLGQGSDQYRTGYNNGYATGYQEGAEYGEQEAHEVAYDEGYNAGRTAGYNEGLAATTTETVAINNLFAALVSVPINVLNGLMPMAVWNTPIVSIIVTFMLLGMLLWIIRKTVLK